MPITNADGTTTVQPGDTLWGIYGADWKNQSGYQGDPHNLQPGTVLKSPGAAHPASPAPPQGMGPVASGTTYGRQLNQQQLGRNLAQPTTSQFGPGADLKVNYQDAMQAKPYANGDWGSPPPQPQMTSNYNFLDGIMPVASADDGSHNNRPTTNRINPMQPIFDWLGNLMGQNKTQQSQGLVSPLPTSQPQSNQQGQPAQRINVAQGTPGWLVPYISKAVQKYGIPPEILTALAKHESAGTFNPTQHEFDPKGLGRGIFQIDLGQHPISEEQAYDPAFATDFAAKLLKEGYDKTGSWFNALRYYNGGPGFASTRAGYHGKPVNQLTQNYANVVMSLARSPVPTPIATP